MLRWLARCQTSILVAALNDLPDADLDLAVVLANVGLRCLAPATVEQRDGGGDARGGCKLSLAHDRGEVTNTFRCICPAQ